MSAHSLGTPHVLHRKSQQAKPLEYQDLPEEGLFQQLHRYDLVLVP